MVAVGKCRLAVRDCIERDGRIGEQLVAVRARSLQMRLGAVELEPFIHHPRCRGADLVLRYKRDALHSQVAMIDALLGSELDDPGVDMLGPSIAPMDQKFGAGSIARLGAEAGLALVAKAERLKKIVKAKPKPEKPE